MTGCQCCPTPQPGGSVHSICNPPGHGGTAIPPGTGYPFWLPFITCMGSSGTILFPSHHIGNRQSYVWHLFCHGIATLIKKIIGTIDPEFLLLPLLGNQQEVIYISIIRNSQILYSNLVELNMKLVNIVQYNTMLKFNYATQSCRSPTAMYILQYEFYKLYCIKFCICT